VSGFLQELLRADIYKRSQGRITRQVTFAALAIAVALGLWRLSQTLSPANPSFRFGMSAEAYHGLVTFGLPGLLLLLGWWIAYRAVNFPSFADFLIAVEAEMNKVSWPSRGELFRASLVVLFMLVFMALTLAAFDVFWFEVFQLLGIY
jgi:preprotein translocase subunit SecE